MTLKQKKHQNNPNELIRHNENSVRIITESINASMRNISFVKLNHLTHKQKEVLVG